MSMMKWNGKSARARHTLARSKVFTNVEINILHVFFPLLLLLHLLLAVLRYARCSSSTTFPVFVYFRFHNEQESSLCLSLSSTRQNVCVSQRMCVICYAKKFDYIDRMLQYVAACRQQFLHLHLNLDMYIHYKIRVGMLYVYVA